MINFLKSSILKVVQIERIVTWYAERKVWKKEAGKKNFQD